jgi:hypothetical protein
MTRALDLYADGALVPGGTQIDEVDHLWASQYRWHLHNGYAARSQRRGAANRPMRIFLHREILGLKHGYQDKVVDHVNGDPLDNRRDNLRVGDYAMNAQNRAKTRGRSKHMGVSWYSAKGCWRVQIMLAGRRVLVGYFEDEQEAARAAEAYYAEHSPYRRQGDATASGPRVDHSVAADHDPSLN